MPECDEQVQAMTETERYVAALVIQLRLRALARYQASLAHELRAMTTVNSDAEPTWQ